MQALFQLSYSPGGVNGSRGLPSPDSASFHSMKRHEILQDELPSAMLAAMAEDEIRWMSTGEAAKRLGVTVRTLYRLIDESQLPAYKFGRVIRLQESQVDAFIEASRIQPGSLEHLYPDVKREI